MSRIMRKNLHREQSLTPNNLFKHSDRFFSRRMHDVMRIESKTNDFPRGLEWGLATSSFGLLLKLRTIRAMVLFVTSLVRFVIPTLVLPACFSRS